MVAFAGFRLPLHFQDGIVAEHLATRESAGLFEVSHLRQSMMSGSGAVAAIESLVAADIGALAPARQVYTQMLNDKGGMIDDLIVTRLGGNDSCYVLVNNAARCGAAWDLWKAAAAKVGATFTPLPDDSLVALQGPRVAEILAGFLPAHRQEIESLHFLDLVELSLRGETILATRSGYTGEDGYEFSVPMELAEAFFRDLAGLQGVTLAGLGARDSLRLEAGLSLYGQDLDETMTPVEAGLTWSLAKSRRSRADFPGASVILEQIANKPPRRRIGVLVTDKGVPRTGWKVLNAEDTPVGTVTSGGFGPSVGHGIALCLVEAGRVKRGETVVLTSGKRRLLGEVTQPPFVAHKYRLPYK